MGKVTICEHPLIQHKLAHIRDQSTNTRDFRQFVEEMSMLIAYEMTKDLPLKTVEVQTPVQSTEAHVLAGQKLGLVPILRAGLGMVEGVLRLYPTAKIGHVGLYRDPVTLQPVEYYVKLPKDVMEREMIVLDPMLATGGSAIAAISLLKREQCRRIKFMSLIASPEGIEALHNHHPDVDFYTAAVDSHLDEKGYIVPGLGDAGDRLFGTQ